MKRLILILLIMPALFAPLTVNAYSYEDALKELNGILPESVSEALPDGLFENAPDDPVSVINELDGSFILKKLEEAGKNALPSLLKNLTLLMSVIVISSLISVMKNSISNEGVTSVLEFVSQLCVLLAAYSVISGIWDSVASLLKVIGTFMSALLPMMSGLYAAGGNVTAAAATSTGLAVMITLLEKICDYILFPMLRVCFGLTLVSGLSSSVNLSSVTAFIRNAFTAVITVIMFLLTTVISYQNIISRSADNVLAQTVKFASGNLIPVVGSALGDATQNILSSISLIRSTAGTVSAISLILVSLPVVAETVLAKLSISIASSVAKTLGCEKEGTLLADIGGILNFVLALVAACTVMFLFVLALFAKTTSGI